MKTRPTVASPQTLIQIKYDAAGRNKDAAILAVIAAAAGNRSLSEYLIEKGARASIGELVRSDNASIFNGVANDDVTQPIFLRPKKEADLVSKAHQDGLKVVTRTLALLNIVLPNGTKLADARRTDLQNAISRYEPQARDMMHKAEFFKRILLTLPDDKKVADAMDDAALTSLYEQSRTSSVA